MTPGQTEFPPICGSCGEPIVTSYVGKGKAKRKVDACGCPTEAAPAPEPKPGRPKCSKKGAKDKGDRGEREVVKFLEGIGFAAYRTAGSGAHGSRNNESAQDTDVVARLGDFRWRVESKLEASLPIAGLKTRLSRSDALRVRQDHDKAFWFVPEEQFAVLLKWAAEGMRRARDA